MRKPAALFFLFLILFSAAGAFPGSPVETGAETRTPRVKIEPVLDGAYFEVAASLVRGAEKSIQLALSQVRFYENHPESASNTLIEEVISASRRGVPVELCLDYSTHLAENSVLNLEVGRMMARAGVAVYLAPADKTMHAKILLVDGRQVLLGSTNWSYYSLERNREANLLVKCPENAGRFAEYFEAMKEESLILSPPGCPRPPGTPATGQVDPNHATAGELESVPGIGPALATRIIEKRARKNFDAPADLLEIPGIGEKTLERISPFLYFAEEREAGEK